MIFRIASLLLVLLWMSTVRTAAHEHEMVSGYPMPPRQATPQLAEVEPGRPIVVTRRHPYERSFELYMQFLREDFGYERMTDDRGEHLPHYFFSWGTYNNTPCAYKRSDHYAQSYPAAHHAQFIRTFLRYAVFTGDQEWMDRAIQLGDWNMAHSTPSDSKYPHLPYSTYHRPTFVPQIMIDKAPQMGLAYLDLFNFTDDAKYLDAARRLGETLRALQRPEGNWVQKIDVQTGEVIVDYTSNIIKMVEFFNQLSNRTGEKKSAEAADLAWQWLLDHPVKDLQWKGGYEDWTDKQLRKEFQWMDTAWTVIELVRRRNESPAYLDMARPQFPWVVKTFGHWDPLTASSEQLKTKGKLVEYRTPAWMQTVPRFDESTVFHATPECTVRWAWMNAAMYVGTGRKEPCYLEYAVGALNSMTYQHLDDGRAPCLVSRLPSDPETYYYSLCTQPVRYTLEIFKLLPELCSPTENHILDFTSAPIDVSYSPSRVHYRTRLHGCEQIKLTGRPVAVLVNGQSLPESVKQTCLESGWTFDGKRRLLHVSHDAGNVVVKLEQSE